MKTITLFSMLHEGATANSATRRFRHRAVIDWTVTRAAAARGVGAMRVVCFDDQVDALRLALGDDQIIHRIGPRTVVPMIESIAAARRWADGWRGGLLNSTEYDLGFDARLVNAIAEQHDAEAVCLINPAAGLLDSSLLARLLAAADESPTLEYTFLSAAPGFGAVVLRTTLLRRLAPANLTPARLFTYHPDAPIRDALAAPNCVETPVSVARALGSYKLDSQAQIDRFSASLESLNGQLLTSSAEKTISMAANSAIGDLPRDLVVELCTRRKTSPIYSACRLDKALRPDMTLENAERLFADAAARDDLRLTFAGAGDPLLHPQFVAIADLARSAGIRAVNVETDLLSVNNETIDRLASGDVDVVSVHVPATTPETYRAVMGVDALAEVIENIKRLVTARATHSRGVPIVAPTFVKMRLNLAEMESWYDQWLRAVGTAVVVAPSTWGGAIEDTSVGDMSPPARVPCRRLGDRMTVLADGTVVRCEEDAFARRPMGRISEQSLGEIWSGSMHRLRTLHADRKWGECQLCAGCREWHRP